VFVRKVDGSLRLCIDYRGLNEITRKDAYPHSRVDDTLDELNDTNFYTHLAYGKFEYVIKTSTRLRFKHIMA
jgi:hypothetical protein